MTKELPDGTGMLFASRVKVLPTPTSTKMLIVVSDKFANVPPTKIDLDDAVNAVVTPKKLTDCEDAAVELVDVLSSLT